MDTKEKIIFHIVELGLLGLAGYCFAKAQYYQGRIDRGNEITKDLMEIKDKLEEKFGIVEGA